MRAVLHALFVAPFADLCDPRAIAELAVAAESVGWDGVFVWDHLLRPAEETELIGDAWISLAAIAAATSRVRLGAMVTPITRRRPQRLARETVAVDRLSGGRLIVGLGLGVDSGGELSRFGEAVDPIVRGARLDEGAELLLRLWSGEPVDFTGEHFRADGVRFLPRPVQTPHPPLWFAARGTARRPLRRAARLGDGIHAIEMDRDGLRRALDEVLAVRGTLDGFDVACPVAPGEDGAEWAGLPVSWAMHSFGPTTPIAEILSVVAAGPPR